MDSPNGQHKGREEALFEWWEKDDLGQVTNYFDRLNRFGKHKTDVRKREPGKDREVICTEGYSVPWDKSRS